jgi:hypothetical protein
VLFRRNSVLIPHSITFSRASEPYLRGEALRYSPLSDTFRVSAQLLCLVIEHVRVDVINQFIWFLLIHKHRGEVVDRMKNLLTRGPTLGGFVREDLFCGTVDESVKTIEELEIYKGTELREEDIRTIELKRPMLLSGSLSR